MCACGISLIDKGTVRPVVEDAFPLARARDIRAEPAWSQPWETGSSIVEPRLIAT